MTNLFGGLSHKVIMGIVGGLTILNGTVMHPVRVPARPQPIPIMASATAQTSIVTSTIEINPATSTVPETSSTEIFQTADTTSTTAPGISSSPHTATSVTPDLLPKVILHKIQSAVAAPDSTSKIATSTAKTKLPSIVTPQWIFDHTTTTFKQLYGGSYEAMLATAANGHIVTWTFDATSFGGVQGIPLFTSAISCNPPPSSDPNSPDLGLIFSVASPYTCTVSLTPLTGTDRRTQSETISFTTPRGELMVSHTGSMNSLLTNDENDGGIVFTNTDASPVNITGLTLDVSYSYLSTTTKPLILRLFVPGTENPLSDYHLENLPQDPSNPYTSRQPNLNASVVFTIPAASQKMLPIKMLGVTKMFVFGSSPSINIIVRAVTTNRTDLKTVLNAPTITWTCTVPAGGYDPNATSGPMAAGTACHG